VLVCVDGGLTGPVSGRVAARVACPPVGGEVVYVSGHPPHPKRGKSLGEHKNMFKGCDVT
jgi:hypothetical protein